LTFQDGIACALANPDTCFSTQCVATDASDGTCQLVANQGASCNLPLSDILPGVDVVHYQCFTTECGPSGCEAVELAADTPCIIAGVTDQCAEASCQLQGGQFGCYQQARTGVACVLDDAAINDLLANHLSDFDCYEAVCDATGACVAQLTTDYSTICVPDWASLGVDDYDKWCYSAATCSASGCVPAFTPGLECSRPLDGLTDSDLACYVFNCDGATQTCLEHFDASRTCLAVGVPQCQVPACVDGGCHTVNGPDGGACDLDLASLYGGSASCYSSACEDGVCVAIFSGTSSTTCTPDAAPVGSEQCYTGFCNAVTQTCDWQGHTNITCSDGLACTIDFEMTDPVTGDYTDACRDAADGTIVCTGKDNACYVSPAEANENAAPGCAPPSRLRPERHVL
jgi:hypothetical protein